MPLGPDRCNGPSGYKDSTIPPPHPSSGVRVRILLYFQVIVLHCIHDMNISIEYYIYLDIKALSPHSEDQ
jgi:hypothetical protein